MGAQEPLGLLLWLLPIPKAWQALAALPADPSTAQGWLWDRLEPGAAPWQPRFVTSLCLGHPEEEQGSRAGSHCSFPSEQGGQPSLCWHSSHTSIPAPGKAAEGASRGICTSQRIPAGSWGILQVPEEFCRSQRNPVGPWGILHIPEGSCTSLGNPAGLRGILHAPEHFCRSLGNLAHPRGILQCQRDAAGPRGFLHPPLPSAVIPMPLLQRAWNSAGNRAGKSRE